VRDPEAELECLNWKGRIAIALAKADPLRKVAETDGEAVAAHQRVAYFGDGAIVTPVYAGYELPTAQRITGPAIIEEPTTTLVVYPGMMVRRSTFGNYLLDAVVT